MNYQLMGLPEAHGQNAFTALVPRKSEYTYAPPAKRVRPSTDSRTAISMMSDEERKERSKHLKQLRDKLEASTGIVPSRDRINETSRFDAIVKYSKLTNSNSAAGYAK